MEGVYAERSFLPERANLKVFQRHGFPLFSLESKMPLQRFDLVGFSLLSELNFTNVLQVLDLALLPLQAAARPAGPLVAAGGMATVNPEPLADFIDFFALGDGELIFPDLVQVLRQARCGGWPKEKTLRHLASLESIYVPRLYPLEPRGFFLVPNLGKKRVRKRLLPDLGRARDEAAEIVPIGQTVFNRLTVEIARGCGQCCRFCQARSYYAPFRPKEPAATLEFIGRALGATGYEAFSLSSLSSGDYPWLADLLERLPALMAPGISFSVPSLRPATLSPELLATLMRFRRTGLTIVAEAGSERLRRVINKDVENREIFRAVELALEHRWQRVKMYFMLGLPTETDRDIEESDFPARAVEHPGEAAEVSCLLFLFCTQAAYAVAVGRP